MTKELFLALIVSLDTYLVSAAYCNSGIKIPAASGAVINILGAAVLGLSIKFSEIMGNFIPANLCRSLGTVILVFIGAFILLKGLVRNLVARLSEKGELSLKIKGSSVVLKLYLDDTAADFDNSKVLSIGEAAALALASSLDSAAIGLSSGMGEIDPAASSILTFLCGSAALLLGNLTGKKISSLHRDFSWLGGIFLIIFAFFSV
ncbi:MAG TPA: manganese efflux pump [Ruminococcus sp.]